MINVCIYSGPTIWKPVFEKLKEEKIWNYVMWLSKHPKANYMTDASYMSEIDHKEYKGLRQDIYQEIYKDLYIFMDMYSRHTPLSQNQYNQKNIHDFLNIFNRLFDYFTYHLISNSIDLVIINRAPHTGHDYILYKIARALNIKTLILEPTILFVGYFFYYFRNEDYGLFDDIEPCREIKEYKIEDVQENYDKYMINLWNKKGIISSIDYNSSFLKFANPFKYINAIKEMLNKYAGYRLISELCSKDFRGQAIYRYDLAREYRKNITSIIHHEIDYSKNYVYFPLHWQPEKTTSNWGGIFNDQTLALERLSKFIPEDWNIFVKENPKQTEFMRGKWFFERLKAIKNCIVVPNDTDTYKLIEHSKFVATISGSVGWESIIRGKKILIFGMAWYKTLPGVFTFNNKLTLNEIISYKIDKHEIEKKMGELYSKVEEGFVYREYHFDFFGKKYDSKENTAKLVTFCKKITKLIETESQ